MGFLQGKGLREMDQVSANGSNLYGASWLAWASWADATVSVLYDSLNRFPPTSQKCVVWKANWHVSLGAVCGGLTLNVDHGEFEALLFEALGLM